MGLKGNPEDQIKTVPRGRQGSHRDLPGGSVPSGTRQGEGSSMSKPMATPPPPHKQGHSSYSLRNNLKGDG